MNTVVLPDEPGADDNSVVLFVIIISPTPPDRVWKVGNVSSLIQGERGGLPSAIGKRDISELVLKVELIELSSSVSGTGGDRTQGRLHATAKINIHLDSSDAEADACAQRENWLPVSRETLGQRLNMLLH